MDLAITPIILIIVLIICMVIVFTTLGVNLHSTLFAVLSCIFGALAVANSLDTHASEPFIVENTYDDTYDDIYDYIIDKMPGEAPQDKTDHADDIVKNYDSMGSIIDNGVTSRMLYSASQSKEAIDNRAKYHIGSLLPFLDEELRANEARDWWDLENDYLDEFM